MSFVRTGIITLVTLVLSGIALAIWVVITARTLGPTGMGILAIAMLYPVFFFTVGNLTLGVSIIHYIGQKKYPLENFVANSALAALVMGVISYLLFVATLPLFQDTLYKGVDPKYLYLAFTIVPLNLLAYLLSNVLLGSNHIKEYNIINLSRPCFAVVCLIILVAVFSFGVMGAVTAFVLSFLFAAAIAIYYASRLTKSKWQVNLNLLGTTLKSSGKMHIGSVATFTYSQVGLMIANYYLTSAQVGYFAVALVIAQFLLLIPQAAQIVLYPETAMATEEEAVMSSARVCRHVVFWMVLAALAIGFLGKYIVWLFAGKDFFPSVAPLIVLLPGVVLFSVASVLAPLWVRKGWFWVLGASGALLAVISILLNLLLIPRYDIMGAAVASSLTYLVGFVVIVAVNYRFVSRNVLQFIILQPGDVQVYRQYWSKIRGMINWP